MCLIEALLLLALRALPDSLDTSEPASGEQFGSQHPFPARIVVYPALPLSRVHGKTAGSTQLTPHGGGEAAPHLGSVSYTLSFISHHFDKILVGTCGVITAFRYMGSRGRV